MKRLLFSILSVFACAFAQAQSVPNGGFENWTTTNIENLQFYSSSNTDHHNGVFHPANAVKTTDSYHGSYAVKLTTTLTGTDTAFAYIANGQPGSAPAAGGIPYNQKPSGFRLYYKSNIVPGDSALIIAEFKLAGAVIGTYLYKISNVNATYTLFNPTFSPALSATPDTVIFACASSNAMSHLGIGIGSMIQIDSLTFTGVSSQPAFLNGDFELWQTLTNNQLNGWATYQNTLQTTDKYSGAFAVELQTLTGGLGNSGIQTGFATSGIPTHTSTIGGYPFSNMIDTLVFYYKYFPADFNDSAVFFYTVKKNGVFIGGYNTLLNISANYKMVQIPINLSQTPDTLIISMQSSKIFNPPASYIGADFKVDNMYLKSQTLPISSFNLPAFGCLGQPIQLIDNSANAANSWNWITPGASPSSSVLQDPVITYSSLGTYTISMIASNSFGSGAPVSHTIAIYAVPSVLAASATVCPATTATLTATGAMSYTWSTGATGSTFTASPSVSTTFTVLGTSSQGCIGFSTAMIVDDTIPHPDICLVSVDSTSTNNIIYWDKTLYSRVDSFIIYREVSSNVYHRIGAQSYATLSQFVDTVRSVGPANGNPNIGSYRYKLQIRDSCGNYGPLGNYHNTLFFVDLHNGTFNWNLYTIENHTTPVTNFELRRDSANIGVWRTIGTVTGNQISITDPMYLTYQSIANWRVQALGFSCIPTARYSNNAVQTAIIRSKSNITNNRVAGVKQFSALPNQFLIYPNPSNGDFRWLNRADSKTVFISVFNQLGECIYTDIRKDYHAGNEMGLNLKNLPGGVYILKFESEKSSQTERILIVD